jgi:hypothetical protein
LRYEARTATAGHVKSKGQGCNGQNTLSQKDFGIKPYKALLGTLKVKNELDVAFDFKLECFFKLDFISRQKNYRIPSLVW